MSREIIKKSPRNKWAAKAMVNYPWPVKPRKRPADKSPRVWAAMAAEGLIEPWDWPPPRKRRQRPANGLLMPREAAERLGITVEQLSAFIRDGALHYVNVGRGAKRPRYRFTEADINELIDKRKELGVPCPSTDPKRARHTSGTTSKSVVVGFMARRAAQIAAKRKR